MKQIYFLLLSCCFFLPQEGKSLNVNITAESAILINADTGAILYEKNAHKQQFPASITKIATVLYALHVRGEKLDKMLTAEHEHLASISQAEIERSNYTLPSHWLVRGATIMGLKYGENLSLEDLIYGTMLVSGGDSSNLIASYIGGTIPKFMALLNEYVAEIGCKQTHFKNPHGLHHPNHYTTAYDMALITKEAMKHPFFRKVVKTVRYKRPKSNKQPPTTIYQKNKLLVKGKYYYPKAIGVKTGYHSQGQCTLVAAAKDGDRTLIAVIMKTKNNDGRFFDAIKLFEAAFKEKKIRRKVLHAGKQNARLKLAYASKPIATYTKQPVTLEYYPSEQPKITCSILWEETALPVKKDEYVGALCFQDQEGRVLYTEPLFALNDVNKKWQIRFKAYLSENRWVKIPVSIAVLLLLGGLLFGLISRLRL